MARPAPVMKDLRRLGSCKHRPPPPPTVDASELPKNIVVGTDSFGKRGYSICPQVKKKPVIAAV
jgi:hypothetical protein